MNQPEKALERAVLLALGSVPDLCIWRNPTGAGYQRQAGPLIEKALAGHGTLLEQVRAILVRNRISYGLGVGSPDLVASVAGRFCGLELKGTHPPTCQCKSCSAQKVWRDGAARSGALVQVIRSVDEAEAFVARARRGG